MDLRGISTLLAVLFLCVTLLGSQTEASVLGIDLGTEVFKGVIVKPGMPLEIVLNRETNRKTAAVVAISNNQRFFGEDALVLKTKQPRDTFADLLGLVGRRFSDPVAERYRSRYPNKMVEVPERGTIAFEVSSGDIYTVEELVGMILSHAKDQAEAMGQEPVEGVVLTVPPFFDQVERQAILDAASIAGLKVLSLMNVDTAAALNFGMAKRFDTKQRHIFYDIGTGSTKVSLVSFGVQQVKEKNKTTGKAKAVNVTTFEVEAVAFDRELNGREFDFCLQKILVERFQQQKGVKTSVTENPRAMAKILKEAQRVKTVLSANQDYVARVEDAHDSVDLFQPFSRKEFEESCDSLFQRVLSPLQTLVEKNNIALAEIDSVTLVGGGTRIPKVQAILKNYLQRELGQNLNTDEAPVFGAAFRAATLSKRFKVKDIRIKDITPYTINVVYHSDQELNEEGEVVEAGNKEFRVFKASSPVGTKKQISFRKISDFTFELVYNETENQSSTPGAILSVDVRGFEEEKFKAQLAKLAEGDHPKVTVVVNLDDSGLVEVDKAEALFRYIEVEEKAPEGKKAEDSEKKESFSEKIFSYFTGKKNKDEKEVPESELPEDDETFETEGEEPVSEEKAPEEEKKTEGTEKEETPAEEKKDEEKPSEEKKDEEKPEKQLVEVEKIQKVKLKTTIKAGGVRPLTSSEKEQAISKMKELIKHEERLRERAEAFNNLEAHIYSKTEFIETEDFGKVSSDEERENLRAALSEGSEWLYGDGFEADTQVLKDKLKELKDAEAPLLERYQEWKARPETVERLRSLLALGFKSVENVTAIPEEDRAQTKDDIEEIQKELNEVQDWLNSMVKKQEEKSLLEQPILKVKDITSKASSLLSDLQRFAKKTKPKPKKEKAEKAEKAKPKKEKKEEKKEEEAVPEEEAPKEEKPEEQTQQEQQQAHEEQAHEDHGHDHDHHGHDHDHDHEEL